MQGPYKRLESVKIARVSTVSFFIETQLRSQIAAIAQTGAEVTVVASDAHLGCDIPDVRYVPIEIPRKIEPLRDIVALARLWLFFRRSNFDIVHSTTPKAGLLCAVAAKLAGVPVRLHTFTGQAWVGMSGIKRLLSKGSDKLIALLNTRCYADSHSQKTFLVESGVTDPARISVLGAGSLAGIDLKRFDPERFDDAEKLELRAELGIPVGVQMLLFVGRLTRDKGIIELLDAFKEVFGNGQHAYLVLLGPHEMDIDALLKRLVPALRERIVLPGFSVEPERYMATADLLLLPSYREGFGTVVIEAAAMGLPVVCTDIYGLTDAVVDGETGLLVTAKDVKSLAAAIDRLLLDSELRRKMSRCARARVEREFSSHRMNKLVIDEYANLLPLCKENLS
jgi:glycosyltransferase involved in cell wall biosynthesis